ncbi:unnamed protein product [Lampetra fluviatilis]
MSLLRVERLLAAEAKEEGGEVFSGAIISPRRERKLRESGQRTRGRDIHHDARARRGTARHGLVSIKLLPAQGEPSRQRHRPRREQSTAEGLRRAIERLVVSGAALSTRSVKRDRHFARGNMTQTVQHIAAGISLSLTVWRRRQVYIIHSGVIVLRVTSPSYRHSISKEGNVRTAASASTFYCTEAFEDGWHRINAVRRRSVVQLEWASQRYEEEEEGQWERASGRYEEEKEGGAMGEGIRAL